MADQTDQVGLMNQTLKNTAIYGNQYKQYKTLQEWVAAEQVAGYNLQGYIDKYGVPDMSKGQHLTDEFKLPNHITFSTDSIYHNDQTPGGKWEQIGKQWQYTPSAYVIQQQGLDKLKNYFKNSEPNSILNLGQ